MTADPDGNRDLSFYAPRWNKVYLDWLDPETIQDWCISRQLWWGHRIPAYYCDKCGHITVSIRHVEKCEKCGGSVHQDNDVLDTWFSSWLWPLTTLGSPDETDDLKNSIRPISFSPLTTSFLFFWVARMAIAGYEFRSATPFRECVFTGLIRDEHGKKMSKSAGNAVDPLLLIDEYGRNALRFTLTQLSFAGRSQDINLTPTRLRLAIFHEQALECREIRNQVARERFHPTHSKNVSAIPPARCLTDGSSAGSLNASRKSKVT